MGTGQELTIRIDARNGVTRIALSGELDMATVPTLGDRLTAVERDGARAILLDLRDLRFLDSTGLHALVRAHERSKTNGHRLLLVGVSPVTRRLCEITGTEFLLDAMGTSELLGRFTGDGSRLADREDGTGAEHDV